MKRNFNRISLQFDELKTNRFMLRNNLNDSYEVKLMADYIWNRVTDNTFIPCRIVKDYAQVIQINLYKELSKV